MLSILRQKIQEDSGEPQEEETRCRWGKKLQIAYIPQATRVK